MRRAPKIALFTVSIGKNGRMDWNVIQFMALHHRERNGRCCYLFLMLFAVLTHKTHPMRSLFVRLNMTFPPKHVMIVMPFHASIEFLLSQSCPPPDSPSSFPFHIEIHLKGPVSQEVKVLFGILLGRRFLPIYGWETCVTFDFDIPDRSWMRHFCCCSEHDVLLLILWSISRGPRD